MRTNLIIPIVIAVIIIALGVVFAMNRSNETATDTSATSESVETSTDALNTSTTSMEVDSTAVTYTIDGFSPSTVNVKQGQTITFTNNSTNSMWVASDPHPTHTKYGEFDSQRNVNEGGSYSFTFTKPGSWTYHNHTQSSDRGTVIVE